MIRTTLSTLLVAASFAFLPATASATGELSLAADDVRAAKAPSKSKKASKKFRRGAKVTLSAREVNEGDRLTVRVKVKSPKRARRVILQRWNVPLYYGSPTWKDVSSAKARGRRNVNFTRVTVGPDSERYRARVLYKKAKPARSAAKQVKVWRWISLRSFTAYYSTVGAAFTQQSLNGREYSTWGGWFGAYRSWEAKFTPGRNCKGFRGIVALADHSDDGAVGAVVLSADDEVIYQSPVLTPGMQATMEVAMTTPYRIWLQALNTSDEGVRAYPNIGDPALLCSYA